MHAGDAQAVTRHADEAGQALIARLGQCVDGAARRKRGVPLLRLDQVVQLNEIDLVHPEPFERALEAGPGAVARALAGLGGEEVVLPAAGQPRRQPQLGVAVTGGGVNVVDAESRQPIQYLVGLLLPHGAQGRGAEDDPAAVMTGTSEGGARNHARTLTPWSSG